MRLTTLGSSRGIAVLSGLFLLLGAAILTGWLYLQVVKPGQRASYFIFMEDVSGVRPGTEVRVNGYAVGQVSDIEPDLDIDRIVFRVDIVVDRIWPIPVDSTITIARDGLLSTPILELSPGKTETPLPEGGRLLTVAAPPSITDQVSSLIEEQVAPTLAVFTETITVLQAQIDENVPAIIDDARTIMASTSRTVAALESEVDKLAAGLGDAGEMMSRLSEEGNAQQIEDLINNLEQTSRNLKAASVKLEVILDSSSELVASSERILVENEAALRNTVEDTEFTMQSLSTSINIVMQNLERASQEIAALAGKINDNPSLILGSDQEETDPFR
jgi:virulence factor Mce-like protein